MKPTIEEVEAVPDSAPVTSLSPSLFDPSRNIEISVTDPESATGLKSCLVRFPTDIEWCDRSRHMVAIRRNLGRDAVKTDVPKSEQINAELFHRIRLDVQDNKLDLPAGPPFDEAEAAKVIERLERATITNVEKVGAHYIIEMKVLSGSATKKVVHTLKVPTQRQIMDFGKSAVSVVGRRTSSETRVMLEPSGELWDKISITTVGYIETRTGLGVVPIIHKDASLTELLMQVQQETEGDDPES